MKCPFCGKTDSKVIDSRPTEEGSVIKRRRECTSCERRFNTYERMETIPIIVIKKDKSREEFSREKLLHGLIRACEKRPIATESLEAIVDNIETTIDARMEREIKSGEIGELVMERIKAIDEVAYVRFASVYRQFKDVDTFLRELNKLLLDKKHDA